MAASRNTRETIDVIRAVLEPLGCTVAFGRHTKHIHLEVTGPKGQSGRVSVASSAREAAWQKNGARQEAQRIARSWGLIS